MINLVRGLRDLLERGKDLPTLPLVVLQLHSALDDERSDITAVAAIVERDPAMTARLLRLANSAFYARGGGRVGSVHTAISMLGIGQLRAMCLVLAVVKMFRSNKRGLDHSEFWRHSTAVGLTAQLLATRLGPRSDLSTDDMYVAGLLHDVGLLVMDQFFPKEMATVCQAAVEAGEPLWRTEADSLGLDHGEVGSLLLGRWALPAPMIDAVAHHHHPEEAHPSNRPGALLVRAAEILCSSGLMALSVEGPADGTGYEMLKELGFRDDAAAAVLNDLTGIGEKARSLAGSF